MFPYMVANEKKKETKPKQEEKKLVEKPTIQHVQEPDKSKKESTRFRFL